MVRASSRSAAPRTGQGDLPDAREFAAEYPASGTPPDVLVGYVHRVLKELNATGAKEYTIFGDEPNVHTRADATEEPEDVVTRVRVVGHDFEKINLPELGEPKARLAYVGGSWAARSADRDILRSMVAAWEDESGRAGEALYSGIQPIEAELTGYGFLFRAIHFLSEVAGAIPAKAELGLKHFGPATEVTLSLEGKTQRCADCRAEHRAGLCEDVRKRTRIDKIGKLWRPFENGGRAEVRLQQRKVWVQAASIDHVEQALQLWSKVEAEEWPGR